MMRMIIADDEWLIRESLHHGINWSDFDIEVVGVAADGVEALELIKTHSPHLLLTDIRMPGIEGLELIRSAKEMLPNLKSIIISGFGEFEYAQKALKIGANDYVLKPIVETDLISIVQKLALQVQEEEHHTLLKMIQGEQDVNTLFLKAKYAIICWDGDFHIKESGIRSFEHEKILFIEEAHLKTEFFKRLNELFIEKNIVAGCSELSEESSDLPHLLKQAHMAKEQCKARQVQGCLFYEQAHSPIDMEEVLQFIHEHYREAISLQNLAVKFFISDSYLSRIFKQHTGKNFIEYVTEYRVTKAKELLTHTSLKPSEVSHAVGYSDQRYFSQLFRKHTGRTPTSFKKDVSLR